MKQRKIPIRIPRSIFSKIISEGFRSLGEGLPEREPGSDYR
jgi:hypothetical protein